MKEVTNAVKSLKSNRAPGKDRITAEIIKASISKISDILLKLLNVIFQTGIYPNQWKDGVTIPILKNGDPNDANNYRGITLTSCLGKVLCLILNKRIETYLEENNILSKEQGGFRKYSRTTDQIFVLKRLIDSALKKEK